MKHLKTPPQWVTNVLHRLCKPSLIEEMEGDLLEFYQIWLKEYGPRKARRLYILHAFKFLRLYSLKTKFPFSPSNIMIDNHLKIAWRNLRKNRSYSFINILGLTLGLASSLMIYLWVHTEITKDHQHGNNVFNVYSRGFFPGGTAAFRNTPARLPAELEREFPEIEYATGFATSFRLSLQGLTAETFEKDEKILKLKGSKGSPHFFKVFNYQVLHGSAENALLDPSHIAISRNMANIFFGSPEAAMNQSIRYQNEQNLIVSLVFEDIGDESSLQFDYLTNWQNWVDNDEFKTDWDHFGTQTYIKLQEGADPESTEEKIRNFLTKYIEQEEGVRNELGLQLFEDQYLYGNFENGEPTDGRMAYVRVLQGIAGFILLIAIINFINLATATASERIKEIGIRKVIGATKRNLRWQFLTESMLLTFLSFGCSLIIVLVALPSFSSLSGVNLKFPGHDVFFWINLLLFALGVGLMAGSYPSWVLAKVLLIPALRKKMDGGARTSHLRKGLVVFQFSLSIVLTVGTIVVSSQMQYLLNKSLGFNRQNLIYVPIEGVLATNYSLFHEEASKVPGVLQIDRSSQTPHNMGFSGPFLNWAEKEENDNTLFTPSSVGFDFIKTMQLKLVEGRDFDRSRSVDLNNFIINETAKEAIGGEVLGKTISVFGKEGKVIGIVEDFHFQSLHIPIKPMVLDVKEGLNFGTITLRIDQNQIQGALVGLQNVYEEVNPGQAFEYSFVDNSYKDLYQAESTMSSLIPLFSGLAIIISCLGLFGLVTFSTQQRAKEIGIRKVLGASITHLLRVLSKDFTLLLILAIVVATPLSYWAMKQWLSDFAYRIDLSWWVFGLAALITIGISYTIVGSRVLKSVFANPVESLSSE